MASSKADTSQAHVERLGITDLERRLGVERSTIFRWYRAGKFPEPHYLGERRVWFVGEIMAWEARRMAEQATGRRGARNLQGAVPSPSAA